MSFKTQFKIEILLPSTGRKVLGIMPTGILSEVQRQKEQNKIRKGFKMRSFLIDIYSAMSKFIKMHQHQIRFMTSKPAGILF